MSLGLAVFGLALSEMKGAQSSFGNVDTPKAGAPVEPPWPAVDWGIQPEGANWEGPGWPAGKESMPGLKSEAEPVILSLRSAKGDVVLNFGAKQDLGLGPMVSVVAPPPDDVHIMGPNGSAANSVRLGNVTFNQLADSLNVWGSGVAKAGDLSHQFQTATITPNVVQSSAISGWAIAGLAGFAVMVAMAIGYYENDRDDRTRRRSSRKSRRRHRRPS
jgi:hypothetical protein